jgi:hypothetical protein
VQYPDATPSLARRRDPHDRLPEHSPPQPRFVLRSCRDPGVGCGLMEATMHGLIYLIGLIVVIMAILSFFGLR